MNPARTPRGVRAEFARDAGYGRCQVAVQLARQFGLVGLYSQTGERRQVAVVVSFTSRSLEACMAHIARSVTHGARAPSSQPLASDARDSRNKMRRAHYVPNGPGGGQRDTIFVTVLARPAFENAFVTIINTRIS